MSNTTKTYSEGSQEAKLTASTLVQLLRERSFQQPEHTGFTFLLDGDTVETGLTYRELDQQARSVAAYLQTLNAYGERVLLLYPPGRDYIVAFFGCLYAGAVAVPAYPPRLNQSLQRLQAIVLDAQPTIALTNAQILSKADAMFAQAPELKALRWLATDRIGSDLSNHWRQPRHLSGETLAFLQYTSGSTARPKGVMVSHQNLLHNESLIQAAFEQTEQSVIVGWLPLYHDMGLIGTVLQPLFVGARCILMSPFAFLQSPFRWLNAISRYRATTSGGPNFAYDLCVKKISAEQRAQLDLSSWSVAFNGAEPIRADTLERFAATFASCGFRREAFHPCYGLAEATLLVSTGRGNASLGSSFDSASLRSNFAVEAIESDAETTLLVGCGPQARGVEMQIVDPESRVPCVQGQVGEIWVAGASVAGGYWQRDEESERVFRAYLAESGAGPYLRTGDLGFMHEGELFVTGRLKDLIIIRGLNHYPQDIESTAELSHTALRPGCGAAFSIEVEGAERLAVVQEVDTRRLTDTAGVLEEIKQSVTQQHEVQPYSIVLIKPGSIPKTSSGKIQRHACRSRFLEGSLEVVAEWREVDSEDAEAPLLAPTAVEQSEADIEQWLVAQLAGKLGIKTSDIDSGHTMVRYGLDSLAAIELMHSVESGFGVTLPVMNFLAELSIGQLASALKLQLREHAFDPKFPTGRTSDETLVEHPVSYGQQSIWFLQQLTPESPAYNIAAPLRVTGALNAAAMRRAFQALVDRHECLRTTFNAPEGEPLQRIHQQMDVSFREEQVAGWSEEAIAQYLVEESQRPFDLERGPLMRVHLLRHAAEHHLLLLVVHHIVADFWSLALLMHELGELYRAEKSGTVPRLAPLKVRYTDYVQWQREMLNSPQSERQRAYWEEQLAGELPPLDLPTDKSRPAVQSFRGASQLITLDERLTEQLKSLGSEHGSTLYMTLLAAFQVLLYRYTGQKDFLVGAPTSGRNRAEWSALIGYFVNPVALRANLTGDATFTEHLENVRRTVLAAFEHQDYPFAALIERLNLGRDLSRPQMFQVMFVLQKAQLFAQEGMAALALPGETKMRVAFEDLYLESIAYPQQVAQFDLTLMAAKVEQGLAVSLQYNTDLFDGARISRLLGHFETLLHEIVAHPTGRISQLNILTSGEWRDVEEWNQTQAEESVTPFVHRLFEEQAEKHPDATAVVFKQERLTYHELNVRANRLAHHLRALGVTVETPVAVCLNRSPELIVALLGILKAGGFYVPLDPAYPTERLAFMLEDSRAHALITRQGLIEELPESRAHLIDLTAGWTSGMQDSETNCEAEISASNLAYVIYTSGSTGKPKGVGIPHAGLSNLITWHQHAYGVTSGENATLLASPAFDASVWELWPYLTAGASIFIVDDAVSASATELWKWLVAEGITISFVPTPLAEAMLEEEIPTEKLALRAMLIGGDKLNSAPRKALPFVLVNHYGPTESTVVATRAPVVADEQGEGAPPIGLPIANTQAFILDEQLQVAPVGVTGELHLSGVGLARGYWRRPELTAEKFIPNPFAAEAGGRLYRTGDLARWLADGQIEFLGRIDHQVKLRGFRIELGEIEAALLRFQGVREAVVMARGDSPVSRRLVAYVVAEDGQDLATKELRAHLMQKLPEYMVPASVVVLNELPITANGKVNRAALPEPTETTLAPDGTTLAPRTPVEELLAGIWCQLLNIEEISTGDNFFELGGHSLLAAKVVTRVSDCFHVEIPLRVLFEAPTVAELAEHIEAALRADDEKQKPPLISILRDSELPLSSAQQRLWFLDQLEPGNAIYNIPAAVRLKGELRLEELQQSLNEIVRRHEALRTTFIAQQGRPVQVIAPSLNLETPLLDLRAMPEDEREAEVARLVAVSAQTPFDLSAGPLLRTRMLRLDAEDHVLMLTIHHIISDGWSISVFIRELKALYEAFIEGRESPLAELTIQYADFADWQNRLLEGEWPAEGLAYWREQLAAPITVLELPTDRPRPVVQTYCGAVETFELPLSFQDEVKALGLNENATVFMILLAAFKVLLYRYTGQVEVTVGTPVAARHHIETEHLIGFFVNTLALRTNLSGEPTFREVLDRVRETALGAYVHQDVPFEKLVEQFHTSRDMSRSPLFQVMLAHQHAAAEALELPGLVLTRLEIPTTTAKFDLLLFSEETSDGLKFALEYNTDLFERTTICRFVKHFQNLLAGGLASPDARIHELPLMDDAEQELLLRTWNDTGWNYAGARVMHEMFEQQVAITPDAAAVQFSGQHLTYAELNSRANRLAHYLRGLGVGPETLVGICLTRSPELVVALLAVLKAGGAYVPLDPNYPPQRIAFIIEDTQAPVLLTQEHLLERIPSDRPQVVALDRDDGAIGENRADNPGATSLESNLAYVIYTSGSTGKPKGVAIEHRSVIAFLNWARETFSAEVLSGVLASTSICFDLSIFELFAPLICGGKIVLVENALQLPALMANEDVKLVNTVPSAIAELVRLRGVPDGVRTINLAGEALPQRLVNDIFEQVGSVEQVWNLYGPSEDTTYSTGVAMTRDSSMVSIGSPLANTKAYILDLHMRPVVVGVAGELYLAGKGLARGYLKRPDQTAEKFIPNPFAAEAGGRLYRTGDVARWRAHGQIEFLGRIDHQVKLRGFRIELGEIEATLNKHPELERAVVVAFDETGEKRLVAYAVARAEATPPSTLELRGFLRETLPDYMIPSTFVMLDQLPLTPNGKIDRQALPAPDASRRDVAGEFVAPRNASEEALVKMWGEVLGLKQVGIYDNFFELGGHSLLATQVMAKLTETFRVELPLRTLFDAPTVSGLAAAIETAKASNAAATKIPDIQPISREAYRARISSRQEVQVPDILIKRKN